MTTKRQATQRKVRIISAGVIGAVAAGAAGSVVYAAGQTGGPTSTTPTTTSEQPSPQPATSAPTDDYGYGYSDPSAYSSGVGPAQDSAAVAATGAS